MDNLLKPRIRFNGFTDVWEQRKLNEVTDVRDGTHDSPKYFEFGHPFITSKNVKNGYINYDDIQYISDEDFNEINKRSKVDKNDILFGMIGTIGNIALIRENPDFAIKNVALIKDIKKINYLYLYQYLQSNNIAKQFDENMDGGTQKFIALNKVRDLSIMYPTISEQIQIGGFLEKLDNLITLHQRKCDKLVELKKSLLEKMFAKNLSNIPEIRFKGFTDVWEQRKLEEISNRFDNLRVPVSANEREKGTTPYYGANGIQDYVKGFTHNGEYVLIAEDGANDLKNYPVKYVNGLFWANNHVHVVQGKEGICDNKYLKYCFTKTNIESLLVGGGRAKLNANIMMGIDLAVPSFNEQVELGRMFYELDNLITLHQRKHEKLVNLKQSLLNDMFI